MRSFRRSLRRLTFCLVALLVIQLVVYFKLIRKILIYSENDSVEYKFIENTIIDSETEAVRIFLRHADANSIPVFPFQKSVLEMLRIGNYTFPLSYYFSNKGLIIFATFNELFTNASHFVSSIKNDGFRHFDVAQTFEEHSERHTKQNVTTYHAFHTTKVMLLLVVFRYQQGNFWWHGKFDGNVSWNANLNDFDAVKREGAYDKVTQVEIDGCKFLLPLSISTFLSQIEESHFITCNYTRAKVFHSLYGSVMGDDATNFKISARKILSLVKQCLDHLGIRFWLSSGTCLGYFRQCDIFPHGRDVDIGIWIKDFSPLIIPTLLSTGMKLKHKFGKVEDSLELSFLYFDIKLDIFFFYEDKDHMWNGGLQAKTGKKFKYIFPKFTLCWTEFLLLKVRVPCNTQQYIEANYGPQWFTPLLEWDWKTSPFNVRSNGIWPENEWAEVVQQLA